MNVPWSTCKLSACDRLSAGPASVTHTPRGLSRINTSDPATTAATLPSKAPETRSRDWSIDSVRAAPSNTAFDAGKWELSCDFRLQSQTIVTSIQDQQPQPYVHGIGGTCSLVRYIHERRKAFPTQEQLRMQSPFAYPSFLSRQPPTTFASSFVLGPRASRCRPVAHTCHIPEARIRRKPISLCFFGGSIHVFDSAYTPGLMVRISPIVALADGGSFFV